jgi:predicted RNA-binding Zn-ribbon protein involved in translation (DUF1610 family)
MRGAAAKRPTRTPPLGARRLPKPTTAVATGTPQGTSLHLLGSVWVASCPTCGYQLTTARTQHRCEQHAARRRCPVCHQGPWQLRCRPITWPVAATDLQRQTF